MSENSAIQYEEKIYSSFEAEQPIHYMSENLATGQNQPNTSLEVTQLCQTQFAFM